MKKQHSAVANYFRRLEKVLKAQTVSYFLLLSFSSLFIFKMALSAFFAREGIGVDWVTYTLITLFVFSFIFQTLILQKKCYPLFLFRVLIVMFIGGQIGERFFKKNELGVQVKKSIIEQNDLLGYRIIPNLHNSLAVQTIGNDTLYKFYLSTDSFSRRIPDSVFIKENTMKQDHPNKHALFLGCSFTIGEGLMYSSTFPYLFEHLNLNYKSYNYGAVGYGPHQSVLFFDDRVNMINEEAIPEEKGFALYTYIDDHMNRVYGSSNYFTWSYTITAPNVYIENDSLIIKKWPQAQLRYANLLRDVVLFRQLGIKFNYPKTESFYKRFASIINYTAKKYWEFRPGNHFYVGIYPGYDKDLNWVQYLDESVVVLRPEPPSDYVSNKSKYELNKYDRHPSKEANVYYAKELTRLIKEYELKNKIN